MTLLSYFGRVRLFATLGTVAHQAPMSLVSSRQEYWNGLSCPPPRDLTHPGMKLRLLCVAHWQAGSLLLAPPGATFTFYQCSKVI